MLLKCMNCCIRATKSRPEDVPEEIRTTNVWKHTRTRMSVLWYMGLYLIKLIIQFTVHVTHIHYVKISLYLNLQAVHFVAAYARVVAVYICVWNMWCLAVIWLHIVLTVPHLCMQLWPMLSSSSSQAWSQSRLTIQIRVLQLVVMLRPRMLTI